MATLRSIKIAIFGNFGHATHSCHFWQLVIKQVVAVCGNLVKQNIARNGKKVTEVLFGNFCHKASSYYFWQKCTIVYSHNREMPLLLKKKLHTQIQSHLYPRKCTSDPHLDSVVASRSMMGKTTLLLRLFVHIPPLYAGR